MGMLIELLIKRNLKVAATIKIKNKKSVGTGFFSSVEDFYTEGCIFFANNFLLNLRNPQKSFFRLYLFRHRLAKN